jgi:hypothetical protein
MRDFLERTDRLAQKLGISLRSLAPVMGISVASLFGYRNGSIPISTKAWRKLEQVERDSEAPALESPFALKEDPVEYQARPFPRKDDPFTDPRFLAVQDQLSALLAQVQSAGLDALAQRGIKAKDVIDEIRDIAKRIGKWPIPPEDGAKQPWLVLAEYREIEASKSVQPKTSYRAPGKSA